MALVASLALHYRHLLSNGSAYGSDAMVTGWAISPDGPADPAWTQAEIATALTRIHSAFITHIIPLLTVSWTCVGTTGSVIAGDGTAGAGFFTIPASVPGTRGTGATPMPPGNCVIVERTGIPDVAGFPARKGRWYLPGAIVSADVNGLGVLTPARVTAIDDGHEAYRNAITALAGSGTPSTLANVSRNRVPSVDDPDELIASIVSGYVVNPLTSFQRSRQRRR